MRIRWIICWALLWLAPGAIAQAAALSGATDVEQQGAWTLQTSTSATITKDYFCASTANFARGYSLGLARNIIGQNSLIVTWPGYNAAPGSQQPMRLVIDGKELRDVQAQAKTPSIFVIALGWDDDIMMALGHAKHIGLHSDKSTVRYNVYDNELAAARLSSCTGSLLERLPGVEGLTAQVRDTLTKAGLTQARVIQTNFPPDNGVPKSESFLIDGIFGGSDVLAASKDDISTAVLDYIDRLELMCKSRFASEIGAPVSISDGQMMVAETKCDAIHTGSITDLVFIRHDDQLRLFYFEADAQQAKHVKALRDKLAAASTK